MERVNSVQKLYAQIDGRGLCVRRRIIEMEAYCGEEDTAGHAHKNFTASPRIGIAYASPHDQKSKWRFTVVLRGSSLCQYPS